ncbi:MAG: response regulator [Brevundimonas sp.]|uniref:response regulator n=1 Tax=Brevundimonas sp. TaxID=1871086 RepID=UPI00248956BD|nr:response regulator [Brevundimonas sp.]MDI1327185.1 response regulator [Brevundimonas sp.]
MGQQLRVLIVEDNDRDAALLLRELKRGGYDLSFERVDTPEAMGAALANQSWDMVISDYSMPRFSAPAALDLVREARLDLPFIIVSGTVGEDVAVESMRAGACDFMPKGQFIRLLPAIERELREAALRADHRVVEDHLRQAQKVEALGQLTGGIAHDFNNLLGVIIGNLDMLIEMLRGDPIQAELADDALNAALRGAELTNRLLVVARQQPFSTRVIDLNERLPGMVAVLQRTLGVDIHINTSLADSLWAARADPSQVENTLLNLAINARDAMPDGGSLTIETANVVVEHSFAAALSEITPGDYVLLSVTDTGVGMPPEVIARATEPFFTTKPEGKGTGLGLSMIYGFAKQSDGHLSIYSEVGLGTTVRLYLPKAGTEDADNVGKAAASDRGDLVRGGELILVVDDNSELLRMAVRRLTGLGYKCQEAENGPTALAILDSGERFDLLFTDIGLPDGISGYALAKLAEQRQPSLKVLFTTGYAKVQNPDGDDPQRSTHMLRKPYRGDELAEKVRAILDSTA